jgi:NAD(P)-dependent dehydrogenase (short-subunit alcohol dehydrogenase family)
VVNRDWSTFIDGRTALVTGSGAGVGRAIARVFARAGATVWINDLNLERAQKVVGEIEAEGLSAKPVTADVTDIDSVRAMRETTGPVDIVVNNAGSGVRAFGAGEALFLPFVETTPESWNPIMGVNVGGVLHVTHTYLPAMIENQWGRILTIVSDAGRKGERNQAVYGAAKAAAMGFTRGLAQEVGRSGITANCIALGTIRHGGRASDAPPPDPEFERRIIRPYPMGRLGRVDDPAPLALLLCSDAGEWITGQVYPVDGGYAPAL